MGKFLDQQLLQMEDMMKKYKELLSSTDKDVIEADIELQEKYQKKLNDKVARWRKDLEDELNELRFDGFLKTAEEVAKFEQAKQQELLSTDLKRKLENQKKLFNDQKNLDKNKQKNERDQKRLESLEGKSDKEKEKLFKKFDREDKIDAKKEAAAERREEIRQKALQSTFDSINQGIKNLNNAVNSAIDSYVKYQTSINTRLQGSGSSFTTLTKTLSDVAYSPYVNAENLYSNLSTLVNEGVVSNVEQRAFLQTIKDGIATTFDANNDNLRRLIRIQQVDSTAARLGLEAHLTSSLNKWVQSTEYLTSAFDGVTDKLLEATSVLGDVFGADASAEFEYTVQKWLGTLVGVGLSEGTAQSIASAIGQLGSGDVSGLSGSAMQNLLVMAASQQGLNYSDLLTNGVTSSTANVLFTGIAQYLKQLGSEGNNVVKNQLANVFGVSVSDLIAARNIDSSLIKQVFNDNLSYQGMYSELASQMGSLGSRMGLANLMSNALSNFTYQTGMGIASSPAMYALWKITDMIESTTGGINIPFVSALGNGVDLNATVEQLMKLGLVGASTLTQIGGLTNSVSSIGNASKLLSALKISQEGTIIQNDNIKGAGLDGRGRGATTSSTTYIGNADSDSYYQSTLNAEYDKYTQSGEEQEQIDIVDYLKEISFDSKFNQIVDDVHAMSNYGISVKVRDMAVGLGG